MKAETRAWLRTERARGVAGPALIVASVVLALNKIVFGGDIGVQIPDIAQFFFPRHCLLGESLAAGDIPAWNPYAMAGAPFVADPLSGWMSLPTMLFYSVLPCHVAVRVFLVFQPAFAGLCAYWFLRGESLSRTASTVAGLAVALCISASTLTLTIQFSSTVVWSLALLAAASRYFQATSWSRRWLWAALTALAWGQLAANFLTTGVILGTGALIAYGSYRIPREISERRLDRRTAMRLVGILAVAFPALSLAFFLPFLGYLPETTLGAGYERLSEIIGQSAGFARGGGAGAAWPLRLSSSPGAYLGAVTLGLAFAAFWARPYRRLALGFTTYGIACYLLTQQPLVSVAELFDRVPGIDAYLHRPERMRFGVIIAIVVLAGLGVEAWRRERSFRRRVHMAAPGLVLWGVLPPLAGAAPFQMLLFLAGLCMVAGLFVFVQHSPHLMPLLPLVLALELVTGALVGQQSATVASPLDWDETELSLIGLRSPRVSAARLSERMRFADDIRTAENPLRLVKFTEEIYTNQFFTVPPLHLVSRVEEATGYTSVQPLRYWRVILAANHGGIAYNTAELFYPDRSVLDLLQVGWIIVDEDVGTRASAARPAKRVASGRGFGLWRLEDPVPRASFASKVRVMRGEPEARAAVMRTGFSATDDAIVETETGVEVPGTGIASYETTGLGSARIDVDVESEGLLIVRNTFDHNWQATVDGEEVPIFRANYLFQGIVIPPGDHVVELAYDDPLIGYGIAGSLIALLALLGAAGSQTPRGSRLVRRIRRQVRPGSVSEEEGASPSPSAERALS